MKMRFGGVLAATVLVASVSAASADGWRSKFPVLKLASVTVESQGATLTRYQPFAEHLGKTLGVKVEVFSASDYAGVVQALSAGQIQLGRMGGAAYASGFIDSNGGIEPLVMNVELDGTMGYHSVLIVRADSVAKTLDDLKGKTLAWADPNSTSGFLVPNVALRRTGIDANKHFGRTVFSGGHEQSVLGVLKGNFDSAFTWTSKGDNAGQLRMMIDRGLMKREDIRVVWESPLIPNPLWAIPKAIPAELKTDLRNFFISLAKENPAMAEAAAQGKTSGFVAATHDMYATIVAATEEQRAQRRSRQ